MGGILQERPTKKLDEVLQTYHKIVIIFARWGEWTEVVPDNGWQGRLESDLGEFWCPSKYVNYIFLWEWRTLGSFLEHLPHYTPQERNAWSLYRIEKHRRGVQKKCKITHIVTLSVPHPSPISCLLSLRMGDTTLFFWDSLSLRCYGGIVLAQKCGLSV